MKLFSLCLILPLILAFTYFQENLPAQKRPAVTAHQPPGIRLNTVATGLNVPWEITWGPDDRIWLTEQQGLVCRVDPNTGSKDTLLRLSDVWHVRTAGLLGMALHEDMKNHPYVFLNYTFLKDKKPFSRLVRYTWKKDTLISPRILKEIPGNNGHNGSRLAFSGGKVFWATGDAISDVNSQDIDSPNGKILRLNIDGTIPDDNPLKGSPVWAMGFRNIQGMAFSAAGQLYVSEHGDANDDEVSLVAPGGNYGWPRVMGYADTPPEAEFKRERNTLDPLKAWTPTIGPAGIDHYSSDKIPRWKNTLLLVTLKGNSLRALKLAPGGASIITEDIFLEKQYGRLRDICISPSGDVYISTSNRDWNPSPGFPVEPDDRILKLSYSASGGDLIAASALPEKAGTGMQLYTQYCASCHKEDAMGIKGTFPPLKGSAVAAGPAAPLVKKLLNGSTGPVTINSIKYDTHMPAFSFLKDEEIADILNYIRSLQSEELSEIDTRAIANIRNN